MLLKSLDDCPRIDVDIPSYGHAGGSTIVHPKSFEIWPRHD